MKKRGVLFGIVAVALLYVCSAMPAWAYTIIVVSEFSYDDGPVCVGVRWGLYTSVYNFNEGRGICPGCQESLIMDDWFDAGICWEDIGVAPAKQWKGCPSPQPKFHTLNACRDIRVILRRSGCDVEVTVH